MASVQMSTRKIYGELLKQRRIFWALLMRELSTRYGRENLGFLWVIAEPLIFASSVTLMWSILRGKFEHGIPVGAFTVVGYSAVILTRHMVNHGLHAITVNSSLLYHRQITILQLMIARISLEFLSVTFASCTVFAFMLFIGQMELPKNLPILLAAWALLGWLSFGLTLIMTALGVMFDFVERIVQVVTYVLVPLSGAFFMVAWIPAQFRKVALLMPFISTTEMLRSGYFGEFVKCYYDVPYVIAWAAGFTFVGLLLFRFVRDHVEID